MPVKKRLRKKLEQISKEKKVVKRKTDEKDKKSRHKQFSSITNINTSGVGWIVNTVFCLTSLHKISVYARLSSACRKAFSLLPILFLLWVIKTRSRAGMAYSVFIRLGLTMNLFGTCIICWIEEYEDNPVWTYSISLCHTMSVFLITGALIMKQANLFIIIKTYCKKSKATHGIYAVVRYTMILLCITALLLGNIPVGHVFNTLSTFVLVAYVTLLRDTENKIRSELLGKKSTEAIRHILNNLCPVPSYYFIGGLLVFINDYFLPLFVRILSGHWPPVVISQISIVRAGLNFSALTLFTLSAVKESNFEVRPED